MTDIRISRDIEEMDLKMITIFLSEKSYWASGRSMNSTLISMQNSYCFAVFKGSQQIAFARLVTDKIVFGWLMDFFVIESEQKKGIGEYLLKYILELSELKNVNGVGLRTKDAHNFYKKFGFENIIHPDTWMLKKKN